MKACWIFITRRRNSGKAPPGRMGGRASHAKGMTPPRGNYARLYTSLRKIEMGEASFHTHQVGVKADRSYAGAILSLVYTENAHGDVLRHPWSSYPGDHTSQITPSDQAGEKAFSTKLSYDFTKLGLTGVTAYALSVYGWGRVGTSTQAARTAYCKREWLFQA